MPWFYYSGNVPKPIPVKKGLSIAVQPHTRVEIFEPGSREVQALQKRGLLRRTGRPAGARSVIDEKPTTAEDIKAVTPKSAMALKIAEKGVTSDKGQAPKRPKGQPEMTEGELSILAKEREDLEGSKDAKESKVLAMDPGTGSNVPSVGADKVEVLSDVDKSPDENAGGELPKKKRKKRRKQ